MVITTAISPGRGLECRAVRIANLRSGRLCMETITTRYGLSTLPKRNGLGVPCGAAPGYPGEPTMRRPNGRAPLESPFKLSERGRPPRLGVLERHWIHPGEFAPQPRGRNRPRLPTLVGPNEPVH